MDFRPPPRGYYVDYAPPKRQPAPDGRPPEPVDAEYHEPAAKKRPPTKSRVKKPSLPASWKKILAILIALGIIAGLAVGYISTKNQLTSLKNGTSSSQTPSQQIINKVGLLVTLPAGESPTIATVNDASKLKSQQFFANAQNGDKVLIYSKSGKAVLYRPSTNRVMEYSKVNLANSPAQ